MLIQFNFKNFKSFKEEVSLDMSATKITEHPEHVANIANNKLLKVGSIYGANASGKSNVYEAFEVMHYYVLNSFMFGGEEDDRLKYDEKYMKVTPFLFNSDSKDAESTFEVFFIDNTDAREKTYQYGFAINKYEITEEWLYSKAKTSREYKTIFYRNYGQLVEFNGIGDKSAENIEVSLEKETLIVSLGAKLKIDKLKQVRDWFYNNEVVNFGDPKENLYRSWMLPKNFAKDIDVQNKVIEYISTFDRSIYGFNVEEEKNENTDEGMNYKVNVLHKMTGSNDLISIPLRDESSGTLKMFALFPSMQRVLENGSVIIIDELNARLHPLLVRNIILTFLNPNINSKNAQLIFTTHDLWQLSNEFFRRDEIWFVEKNTDGVSSLYSLAEFKDDSGNKIRKDESFVKNYVYGKYGAIPSLKSIDMLEVE